MRRTWLIIAAVAVVVAGAGTVWFLRRGDGPEEATKRYLAAWGRGDFAAMRALTADPPADLEQRLTRMRDDLGAVRQSFTLGGVDDDGGSYHADLTLAGDRKWSYTGSFKLTERDGEWRVVWSPAVLYPGLKEGQRVQSTRVWPKRATIQAADGSDLSASPSGSVQQIAGPVGAATDEIARKLGAPYRKGDPAGVDGLNRQYEKRLAGTPAQTVQIVDAQGRTVQNLKSFGGQEGRPLRTTLDPKAQRAAGQALTDVDKPASLVAVRPSTGEILAVANKPGGYNRALMGQYPPGSTFKVVTAAALVADGLRTTDRVGCPATIAIGGFTFKNAEFESFGTVPFKEAFAHSCNTTMAELTTRRLSDERLTRVAEQFGFNAPIIAGLPAVRARFPRNKDATALASASFGQGQVLTSPLNMAGVAAAAANGTWRSPRLVDTATAAQALDAGGRRPEPPKPLEPGVRRALRTLMPAVVSEGTAAKVDFPAGTAGKTGTAEFGSGEDPPTHAWFIGYRGDLAFAVLVEDGGTGAGTAAPIAASFLRAVD
ncbi:penicillin-binding transpeptidase domain-containing protein [Actinomadura kijaniata]|uniref:penicillin-binding transpeptidase domain-containing protein n=1 Tax=Actinomadura kijaniata TaxID=46161 RepID=UPI00082B6CA8|nr:penicillin-binding transpeptidase domain-containing protein [Actinomadura kijaniata]